MTTLVPPSLDQRDAHGGRGRAARRPYGGNLGGDDRAGLRAFPQRVLPGSTSPARQGEGNTGALIPVASSERTKPRNRVNFIRSLAVPSVPIHHSAKEPEVGGRREESFWFLGRFPLFCCRVSTHDRAENLGPILRLRDATIGGDNLGGSNDVRRSVADQKPYE